MIVGQEAVDSTEAFNQLSPANSIITCLEWKTWCRSRGYRVASRQWAVDLQWSICDRLYNSDTRFLPLKFSVTSCTCVQQ